MRLRWDCIAPVIAVPYQAALGSVPSEALWAATTVRKRAPARREKLSPQRIH